jgi:hypothetical protein
VTLLTDPTIYQPADRPAFVEVWKGKHSRYRVMVFPDGQELVIVWQGGRGTWMTFEQAERERWPQATCEECGEPADGIVYEMIDMTWPEDTVHGYRAGRAHTVCRNHAQQIRTDPLQGTDVPLAPLERT